MEQQLLKISCKITNWLSQKVSLEEEEKIIISYQLRIKLSEYMMFVFMFLNAMLFQCQWTYCLAYFAMRITRPYMGGLHHKTYRGCCMHTYLFFLFAILMSKVMVHISLKWVFLPCFMIDILLAPCPSKERGRYGTQALLRLKIETIIGEGICFLTCVIFPNDKEIILVVLIMIHIEFLIKCLQERRILCLSGYAG